MEKYIILGDIYGIGGWQLYIDSRASYRKMCGDSVYIFAAEKYENNTIKLNGIQSVNVYPLFEMRYSPICLTRQQRRRVIEFIKLKIDYHDDDKCFIESTCMYLSIWGEIIAEALGCRNYCFLLHSHIDSVPVDQKKFFWYKYNRAELSGQSEITLPDLFKDDFSISDPHALSATWSDPLCDQREDCIQYEDTINHYRNLGYKVLTYFGTLNKPHFVELCAFIKMYACKNNNANFLFVAIGSSFSGDAEKSLNDTRGKNVVVLNIPELYPVPRRLFSLSDICFSSWGSATCAAQVCKRTIRFVDDISIVPQGIIGVTLRNIPYYKQEKCSIGLEQLVDNILYSNTYDLIDYVYPPKSSNAYEKHKIIDSVMLPFTEQIKNEYYINKIKCNSFVEKRQYIAFHIMGKTLYKKIIESKSKGRK